VVGPRASLERDRESGPQQKAGIWELPNREAPGDLADDDDLRGTRYLAREPLGLVDATAEPSRQSARGNDGQPSAGASWPATGLMAHDASGVSFSKLASGAGCTPSSD